jgi:hypothetical protein
MGAWFGYQMLRDDFLVGLVPVVSSGLLAVFGALSLGAADETTPESLSHAGAPVRRWTTLIVMGLLVLYLLLLNIIGFIADTAALILFALIASGVRRPLTIALTLVVLLGIGFLFQDILGIELPRGMF